MFLSNQLTLNLFSSIFDFILIFLLVHEIDITIYTIGFNLNQEKH